MRRPTIEIHDETTEDLAHWSVSLYAPGNYDALEIADGETRAEAIAEATAVLHEAVLALDTMRKK